MFIFRPTVDVCLLNVKGCHFLAITINLGITSARYLGVYLESSVRFKCSFANNKAKFFKANNNIFGKVGRNPQEEVLFALIKTKCLPILFYGVEACPTNSSVRQSFDTL